MNKLPEELYGKELKILTLPIKKEWFDKIERGEKMEEYREIKDYWLRRMCYRIPVPWGCGGGFLWQGNHILEHHKISSEEDCSFPAFETFDYVLFINGYGVDRPRIWVECKGISIGTGRVEWGAVEGVQYLVTKLGRVLK